MRRFARPVTGDSKQPQNHAAVVPPRLHVLQLWAGCISAPRPTEAGNTDHAWMLKKWLDSWDRPIED